MTHTEWRQSLVCQLALSEDCMLSSVTHIASCDLHASSYWFILLSGYTNTLTMRHPKHPFHYMLRLLVNTLFKSNKFYNHRSGYRAFPFLRDHSLLSFSSFYSVSSCKYSYKIYFIHSLLFTFFCSNHNIWCL